MMNMYCRNRILLLITLALLLSFSPSLSVTDAFTPHSSGVTTAFVPRTFSVSQHAAADTTALADLLTIVDVETKPIAGMKPGTSGLRKKVEVWQGIDNPEVNQHYVENFIQSLLDTAADKNGGNMPKTVLVAGDGRYYNNEAMQIICRVLAANGVANIWLPRGGVMTTPAVSAAIRTRDLGRCEGAIILTASHNPGGPGQDFGIKYNLGFGQPAGEDFTEELYQRSLKIQSFKTLQGGSEQLIDLDSDVGTAYALTSTSTATIIDPFEEYVAVLKTCFDFDALSEFVKHPQFSLLFDGMHGAGGPFVRRVLVQELRLPESCLLRCDSRPDFGQGHPDPNLIYAADLVKKMGLLPDGSADPTIDSLGLPTLGAANDGDGDRNLIAGAGCFVTPSDSLALIADNWSAIPHFSKAGGPRGVARSMPSSAAIDVVAEALGIPCFVTPTGWKFFGNLMSSKELFGQTDYSPFLCGEESFGTGSDHIREKDGLWAALAWISILMKFNEGIPKDQSLVSVKEVVRRHWKKYGRHFYCRYDYEGVDSDSANQVMDLIRKAFVEGDLDSSSSNSAGIKLVKAEEFSYVDPVDGSKASKQGLILYFEFVSTGDPARVVFRLSGTGSAGATIRVYLEKFEDDTNKHNEAAPVALKTLADCAISLVRMQELTGRDIPTVIT